MKELLSAAEAKKMSYQNIENLKLIELDIFNSKIRTAIEKGEFSIRGEGYLNSDIKEKLKKAGYKVYDDHDDDDDRWCSNPCWSISWR